MRSMSFTWLLVIGLGCRATTSEHTPMQTDDASDPSTLPGVPTSPTSPNSAIAPKHRVPLDETRDALRHPDRFLDVANLRPGAQVLELGAGDGYTSMHIAARIGEAGTVFALNPPQWRGFMAPYLAVRLRSGPLPGIQWIERPFDDPIPDGTPPLDLVVNVLTYHDLLYMDVDRGAMNRKLFAATAPGGRYLIVDHATAAPGDVSAGSSLHRIGRQAVIDEVTAAGFRLVEESDALRMPEDDHTTLAWTNPQPRTDRFVLVFERPAG